MTDKSSRIPGFLLEVPPPETIPRETGTLRFAMIEKSLHRLATLVKQAYAPSGDRARRFFFQRLDARVKLFFLLFFMVIVSLKTHILPEMAIFFFVFTLALVSQVNLHALYKRVLFLGFFFGFLIALPSACSLVKEGEILYPLLHLPRGYQFWIYSIPQEIGVTKEGGYGVLVLTMRVINSLSISFLVLITTPFPDLIRALKILKVPDSFLLVITLCHQVLFLFARIVEDMYLAKRSRMIREERRIETRNWITDRMALLFRKTRVRCEGVYQAMIGRGFSDTVKISGFPKMGGRDWWGALFLFSAGLLFLWM